LPQNCRKIRRARRLKGPTFVRRDLSGNTVSPVVNTGDRLDTGRETGGQGRGILTRAAPRDRSGVTGISGYQASPTESRYDVTEN